jgi:hypothetical protein
MGDMEVETEPNVDGQYGEYVKEVEVKQMDDISSEVEDEKNVDVICRLISCGGKTLCLWK